jgi:hypothetical protein
MANSSPAPEQSIARVALLAALLLALGFVAGYGFQSRQHAESSHSSDNGGNAVAEVPPMAPVVKGLRVRPDDRLLAFTGIYDQTQRAARFVFDLATRRMSVEETPAGWQDYITQWSDDGSRLLFEREKIPRPVADASAGLYQEKIVAAPLASLRSAAGTAASPDAEAHRAEPSPLAADAAPDGEKIIAGQWGPDGLIVKTRREPKSLYLLRGDRLALLDRAGVTYYQNRAVRENGRTALYVVRDVPGSRQEFALFRVQNQRARQLGPALRDVVWAYISENARWLIVCRHAARGNGWLWSLYAVTPQAAQLVKEAPVPADVIVVYWSPDFKRVLGSSGEKLWLIDIPTLQVHQLGQRSDWHADDAAWLNREQAVVVAAAGVLWKVRVPDGAATQLWRFPAPYWE